MPNPSRNFAKNALKESRFCSLILDKRADPGLLGGRGRGAFKILFIQQNSHAGQYPPFQHFQ